MPTASFKPTSARLRSRTLVAPSGRVYWDSSGAVFRPAGAIPALAPTTADNGAGNPNGAYTYYVTYYDSANDSETGGVLKTHTTSGAQKVLITFNDTAPTGITSRRVYRNTAGGAVYYRIATVAVGTGTYEDNTADGSLTAGLGLYDDTWAPPPSLQGVHRHAARIFGWNGSTLYWSEASDPEWWPPLNANKISLDDGYDIKALVTLGDDLIIFKELGTFILSYDIDPLPPSAGGDGWTQTALYERGCLNSRCAVVANGAAYSMDSEGIYTYFGNRDMARIDASVEALLARRNMELKDWFFCIATRDRIRWFVSFLGDGSTTANPYCKWAIVLDLESMQGGQGPRWWLEEYATPWRDGQPWQYDAATTEIPENWLTTSAMDAKGKVYHLDWMTSDGVPLHLTATGSVTSTTGSPTVVTVSGGTFTGTKFNNYDLVGLYCTFVDSLGNTTGAYRITAVGAGTFTLDRAVTIANNSTFYIGAIPTIYDLPSLVVDNPFGRKTAGWLDLAFEPSPVSFNLGVQFNRDRKGFEYSAVTDNETQTQSTINSITISVPVGGTVAAGGGLGMVDVAVGSETFQCLQPRLTTVGSNQPWQVYSFQLRDVEGA